MALSSPATARDELLPFHDYFPLSNFPPDIGTKIASFVIADSVGTIKIRPLFTLPEEEKDNYMTFGPNWRRRQILADFDKAYNDSQFAWWSKALQWPARPVGSCDAAEDDYIALLRELTPFVQRYMPYETECFGFEALRATSSQLKGWAESAFKHSRVIVEVYGCGIPEFSGCSYNVWPFLKTICLFATIYDHLDYSSLWEQCPMLETIILGAKLIDMNGFVRPNTTMAFKSGEMLRGLLEGDVRAMDQIDMVVKSRMQFNFNGHHKPKSTCKIVRQVIIFTEKDSSREKYLMSIVVTKSVGGEGNSESPCCVIHAEGRPVS